MCRFSTVNRPRCVALPVPSISTRANGGTSGVTVKNPSKRPLKGTSAPAATGPASAAVRNSAVICRYMMVFVMFFIFGSFLSGGNTSRAFCLLFFWDGQEIVAHQGHALSRHCLQDVFSGKVAGFLK